MTFDHYFEIIVDSARESGYDSFLPSLCSVEKGNTVMKVLDGDISEDGDELVANEWAAKFFKHGTTLFLAYRCGNQTVRVQEFLGSDFIRAKQFILDSSIL